jgi:ATP-dependent Zn protease
MAGSLVSLDAAGGPPGANIVAKVLSSEETKVKLEAILESAKDDAVRLLIENRHIVEALRDALLERDELIGEEILDVIHAAEAEVLDLRSSLTTDLL